MSELIKIVVFVPEDGADALRQAIGAAGAGQIGNYSYCSFSVKGTGRFLPGEDAHPAIGAIGKLETVAEEWFVRAIRLQRFSRLSGPPTPMRSRPSTSIRCCRKTPFKQKN
jgi:hypothetical protein